MVWALIIGEFHHPYKAIFDCLKQKSLNPETTYTISDAIATPEKSDGAPGVALFDYDKDGDLDIYVTNGPNMRPDGVAQNGSNSLYSNQLVESGAVRFVDVANGAGVAAAGQDSTGVCFGDIDNDGDHDLLVLGRAEPN